MPPAAFQLSFPKRELVTYFELTRHIGEKFFVYERRPGSGKLALVRCREMHVQVLGNDAAEHGIAEKFQAFVVLLISASVRKRQLQ
jgi:hypothetical protein